MALKVVAAAATTPLRIEGGCPQSTTTRIEKRNPNDGHSIKEYILKTAGILGGVMC